MKKIFVSLIFVFFINEFYGQAYEIKLNFWYRVDRNVKNRTSSNMTIHLFYSDNTSEQVYYNPIGDNTYQPPTNIVLVRYKQPIKFHITGFVNFSSVSDANWNDYLYLNYGCLAKNRFTYSHSGFQNDKIDFDYSSKPILNLSQPSNNTIAQDQPFNIVAPSGFPSAIYNWEYQLGSSTTWLSVPGTSGQRTMNKAPEDFLTGTTYIGQNIRFQINSCNENYSNIVIYQIILRSPVLRSFIPIDTKCAYGIDGSFTANFERGLKTGEELFMTFYEIDGPNEFLISNKTTEVLDSGNSYSWPDPLPRGNYLIKYQSKLNEVYSSLETSGQFRIGSPSPIIFSAIKTNEVQCHGGSDATIQVHATGGVGNYKYQLNGGSLIPFSNTGKNVSHLITNLPAGTKIIKVQDGNGCTEQE